MVFKHASSHQVTFLMCIHKDILGASFGTFNKHVYIYICYHSLLAFKTKEKLFYVNTPPNT